MSACGVPTRSLTVTASREAATEAATTSVPHNAGKAANRHGLITRPLWSRPSPEPRCTAKRETGDFFESGHVHARKRTPRRRLFRTVLPKCNGQATRSRLKDAAKFIGLIRPWCHARHCGGLTADVSRLSRPRAASRSRWCHDNWLYLPHASQLQFGARHAPGRCASLISNRKKKWAARLLPRSMRWCDPNF